MQNVIWKPKEKLKKHPKLVHLYWFWTFWLAQDEMIDILAISSHSRLEMNQWFWTVYISAFLYVFLQVGEEWQKRKYGILFKQIFVPDHRIQHLKVGWGSFLAGNPFQQMAARYRKAFKLCFIVSNQFGHFAF